MQCSVMLLLNSVVNYIAVLDTIYTIQYVKKICHTIEYHVLLLCTCILYYMALCILYYMALCILWYDTAQGYTNIHVLIWHSGVARVFCARGKL